MPSKPSFLITIDTEGDNLWSKPRTATTKNASYLPRFQELCEKYGFKPTYLTNYEMANSVTFQKMGKDIIRRGVGEIGMHLHAWDMPPSYELTEDDLRFHPYLIEYPEKVMREKISIMTDLLEGIFGVKMLSHRAGRWSFDETYANQLIEFGYQVDCSVTPHVSWKSHRGAPEKDGGTDYTNFPETAYFIDPSDISRPGQSTLLEIPVSIMDRSGLVNTALSSSFLGNISLVNRISNRLFPKVWLRPNGRNLNQMLGYLRYALSTKRDYVEFMLHSSEFMPGGSPLFKSEAAIEQLYHCLESLFAEASVQFSGRTLSQYLEHFTRDFDEQPRCQEVHG
ncbi:MAG: deacetylase [Nitrospira sp. CG24E]|nr:MAG: deacetylase [Nitrospira sp. CG24E]